MDSSNAYIDLFIVIWGLQFVECRIPVPTHCYI